ncbi:MAG TPA: DNA polymerase III subunit delta [Gemmataceae bacterium]|nr:DNA polymerase III subunit delta [Gemmataceae bacterium]
MDSLAFLDRARKGKPQPVYVLAGDEDFLKRQTLRALRSWAVGEGDDAFGYSAHAGDKAVWSSVHDELQTLPFLGGRRLVVVEGADPFVTKHRPALEKYVAAPAATGVLVLTVNSWPATTRLAKAIDNNGTIACKAPAASRLPEWCARWCKAQHDKELSAPAAQLLVELVGPEMGLLDQELAKLSVYVGEAARIDAGDVDRLVGHSRAEDVWTIFDAIGTGKTGEALAVLDRLFDQGNAPQAVLGAFSYQMRMLARAARLHSQGKALPAALAEAGVQQWRAEKVQAQMRHLGRRRLARLYDWLLEVDLGMKGGSQLPEKVLFERLIVRLARKL